MLHYDQKDFGVPLLMLWMGCGQSGRAWKGRDAQNLVTFCILVQVLPSTFFWSHRPPCLFGDVNVTLHFHSFLNLNLKALNLSKQLGCRNDVEIPSSSLAGPYAQGGQGPPPMLQERFQSVISQLFQHVISHNLALFSLIQRNKKYVDM